METHVNTYKDAASAINQDLRAYMLKVFSYMAGGIALTAIIAYLILSSSIQYFFLSSAVILGIAIAQIGIAFYFSSRFPSMSLARAQTLFWTYAFLEGLTMTVIGAVFTGTSIVTAFFITSSMFLSMVIYGYVTQKDLSSWGSLLFMALIGVIIAGIVNMFLQSSMFSLIVSLVTVVLFTALTAYDTQMIKNMYYEYDSESTEKVAVLGAFKLYLDFIVLFINVLRIVGSFKDR